MYGYFEGLLLFFCIGISAIVWSRYVIVKFLVSFEL